MDLATIIGLIGAFAMLIMAILTNQGSLLTYVHVPSLLMTVVGSYFVVYVQTGLSDALGVFNILGLAFRVPKFGEKAIISKLMTFSDKARREGLLALEEELEDLDDEFMKKGLRLVVDGTDAEIIRSLMDTELNQVQERHAQKIQIVDGWSKIAPGMGMLGTVTGLIAMLKNLDDKSSIGPNMSVALITTFYGAILANMVFIPIIFKLREHDKAEALVKEMIIEGVLSIQAGDNPRILALKLLSFLNPKERKTIEHEILKD